MASDLENGQTQGIQANNAKDVSYAENAMYGEQSQQQSTAAKIDTQGGVSAAVGTDVTDATLKASKQQAAVSGELAQQLMKANPDMKSDEANKMAEALTKGGGKISEDIAKALGSGVDVNEVNALGATAIAGAGALAGTMAQGKTAADLKSVSEADRLYEGRGGYIGFQEDAAMVKTQSSVGDTKGLMDIPEEHRESYIEGALAKADSESAKRGKMVREDFMNAGLINSDDSVNPENWVSGTGYLRANNMNSSNALIAGGMVFSGALGEDSTVKADSEKSLKVGDSTTNNKDTEQKISAFNAMQKANGGEQIRVDEDGKINIPDAETGRAFLKSVGNTDMVEKTKQHAIGETLGAIGEELGLSAEQVVYGVGGTVVGGAAFGLSKKIGSALSPVRKKVTPSKTKNPHGDSETDNIDTKHNMTPEEIKSQSSKNLKEGQASYLEYNEERQNLQEDSKKEGAKRKDLETKRENLVANGEHTASVDHEIEQSKSRSSSIDDDIHKKESQLTAQKSLNSKEMDKINKADESIAKRKNNKRKIGGGLFSMVAMEAIHQSGVDTSESRALAGVQNVATTADSVLSAGVSGVVGTAKALWQGMDGDSSTNGWNTFKNQMASSGDTLKEGWNSGIGGADERWDSSHPEQNKKSFSISPAGGSGQIPGGSQYGNPGYKNEFTEKYGQADYGGSAPTDRFNPTPVPKSTPVTNTPVASQATQSTPFVAYQNNAGAPTHINNAFSTPTGFNTSQAMSTGSSNYVNNAKFVSAAESSGANRNIRSSTRDSSNQCQRRKLCRV